MVADRIIINNKTQKKRVSNSMALKMVRDMVEKGEVSEDSKGKRYVFATTYKPYHHVVACRRIKDGYSFTVYDNQDGQKAMDRLCQEAD